MEQISKPDDNNDNLHGKSTTTTTTFSSNQSRTMMKQRYGERLVIPERCIPWSGYTVQVNTKLCRPIPIGTIVHTGDDYQYRTTKGPPYGGIV